MTDSDASAVTAYWKVVWPVVRGFLIGALLFLLVQPLPVWWSIWVMLVLSIVITGWMLYSSAAMTRRKRCMYCGTKRALPQFRRPIPTQWWRPIRGKDIDWVCKDHLLDYIRERSAEDAR